MPFRKEGGVLKALYTPIVQGGKAELLMLKKIFVASILVVFLLGMALLPALLRDRSAVPLVGPELSSFDYDEVEFENGELRLAGMIFLPPGEGPFPVAVIIHGSGPSRRDNKWYLSVSRHLQDNGIAVLLPDKRGCEKSEGNWVGADLMTSPGTRWPRSSLSATGPRSIPRRLVSSV